MQYVVKVDRLGGKAEIRGIGLGDERITRLEITAKDYISSAALPLRITMKENGEEDRLDLEETLKNVFISPSRIQGQQTTSHSHIKPANLLFQASHSNSNSPSFKNLCQIFIKKATKNPPAPPAKPKHRAHAMNETKPMHAETHDKAHSATQVYHNPPDHIPLTTP
jgi:hypothetical protein